MGRTNVLQPPFKGLTEEFMVTRTREVMFYRDSNDSKASAVALMCLHVGNGKHRGNYKLQRND